MRLNKDQKKKLKITGRFLHLCLILLPLLVAATYTWFALTRTPRVNEMDYSVACGTGMEIALAPDSPDEEWVQFLDFSEIQKESDPLKPVTWSDEEQCFFAAEYGFDGRIISISKRLSDEEHASRDDGNGYYIKQTFYARTGTDVQVSLAPPTVGADGTEGSGTYLIGTPVWDGENVIHDNGGLGFEYAVRVGIKITYLKADGVTPEDDSVFYIYEPNCDGHVNRTDMGELEEIFEEDKYAEEYPTPSIDGTDTLVPEEMMIRQRTSTWKEAYPVQRDVIIQDLGEFLGETWLFEMMAGDIAKIDLYIWLEGQDVDCNNLIGQDSQLFMNFQFAAEAETGSGLEPIR